MSACMNQSGYLVGKVPIPLISSVPDIVTFRRTIEDEPDMVYVSPPESYDDAIKTAQSVFPLLRDQPPETIHLALNVTIRGGCNAVRIGPTAWPALRRRITQYEILDVKVQGETYSSGSEMAIRPDEELNTSSTSGKVRKQRTRSSKTPYKRRDIKEQTV